MTRFLLIRHATNDTIGKTIAGRMPGVHLNAEGKTQAKKLAERLAGTSINAIYSSPLERCVETAEPILKKRDMQLSIVDELIEVGYGEWTNASIEELRNDQQFHLFNSFRSGFTIPGGETMLEIQARMVAVLHQLSCKHNGETVAIVGHGDPIRAVIAFYAGIHIDMLQRLEIGPASVSILELYPETAKITLLNGFAGQL